MKKRLLSLLVERSNSWCSARARERVGVDSQVRTADGPGGVGCVRQPHLHDADLLRRHVLVDDADRVLPSPET
ncbi:MAG: hypothetical protein VXZ39_15135, partial [Planctomycetota bacterium]|nr:hypothetical protein [Planctomycetota bacterium]